MDYLVIVNVARTGRCGYRLVVIGYGYNTKNDDTDYQSGDEVHIDFVFNQILSESFAVGLHGIYYR